MCHLMTNVTYESFDMCKWVKSHTLIRHFIPIMQMSKVPHIDSSRRTFKWALRRSVTNMDESCDTYEWVASHKWRGHATNINESYRTRLIIMSEKMCIFFVKYESCRVYERVMSHKKKLCIFFVKYEKNGQFFLSNTSHVACMKESCHTQECVMSIRSERNVTHVNESCHTYEWVMSQMWMSHVTHMNKSRRTYEWVMSQWGRST